MTRDVHGDGRDRLRSTRMPNMPLNFEGAPQRGVKLIATRLDRIYSQGTRLRTSDFLLRRARPVKNWRLGSVALQYLTCATWHVGNGGGPVARPWTAPRAFCARRLEDGARALIVDGAQEPADGAQTVFFDAPDASGFLLAAQQEPAQCGPTLFFDAPDAPGFLLSWKTIKFF